MKFSFFTILSILLIQISCANNDDSSPKNAITESQEETSDLSKNDAKIVSVTSSGNENNYTFSVGIRSNETGCKQYANWWEVITEDGKLIYRRILAHSHVAEQPFIRSGGSVKISKEQVVIIRAHMNTIGYGSIVYKGSVASGFKENNLDTNFAIELAKEAPLPSGCAF